MVEAALLALKIVASLYLVLILLATHAFFGDIDLYEVGWEWCSSVLTWLFMVCLVGVVMLLVWL